MTATTDPNIIAFCCRYCSYAAADLAGSMRLSYPASVKVDYHTNSQIVTIGMSFLQDYQV